MFHLLLDLDNIIKILFYFQPIDRLENKNNEFLGDYYLPDGVQGEKLDKLYGYESEFKMN